MGKKIRKKCVDMFGFVMNWLKHFDRLKKADQKKILDQPKGRFATAFARKIKGLTQQ